MLGELRPVVLFKDGAESFVIARKTNEKQLKFLNQTESLCKQDVFADLAQARFCL